MRLVRWTAVVAVAGSLACALAPGCHTPTQVTVDVRIANASCKTDIHGTALTVGIQPADTEDRVRGGFVTASTNDCSDVSGSVGTLVITPSDPMHASIVVTAAYGAQNDPSACRPSDDPAKNFKNCIVARRSFAFVEHSRLTLPIVLDPDCVNVPCDALSTCRHGHCYSSDVASSGDSFPDPGIQSDGGIDEAGIVQPEGGTGDASDASDGNDGNVPRARPYCDASVLHCTDATGTQDLACSGSTTMCCDQGGTKAVCGAVTCDPTANNAPYCCVDKDCAAGFMCPALANSSAPLRCTPKPPPPLYCDTSQAPPVLHCNGTPCPPTTFCCVTAAGGAASCSAAANCIQAPYCCSASPDCPTSPPGQTCPPLLASAPQSCSGGGLPPAPTCDGSGNVVCGATQCPMGDKCCAPAAGGADYCSVTCSVGDGQVCCKNQDCASGTCDNGGVAQLIRTPLTPDGPIVIGGGPGKCK